MRRLLRVLGVAGVGLLLVPAWAAAQARVAGQVTDTSGGVLPGVTVEASSDVLIEGARVAVTDGEGRYTIINLRPGVYEVTFTLAGFSTVQNMGVELTGSATTTVNGRMAVGALEETITVSGETPTVDLQSTTRQASITQEIVSAIPSARTPFTVGVLIPGVQQGITVGGQNVGGSVVQEVASLVANGGRTQDQRLMVNGVALSSGIAGGWGGGAVPNASGTSEFAIDVSGVDAEAATGGVRVNFIPRDGGNRYSGTMFVGFATESFSGDNYTGSDVQAAGLSAPAQVKRNGDFNPGFGGPILQDKVWFFLSGRYLWAENYVPGMFFNANANDPNSYTYVPTAEQAYSHQDQKIYQVRLTWQANPIHKFGVTMDYEDYCACTNGISATTAPEAGNDRRFPVQRFISFDWTAPVTNNVLLEASAIHRVERWGAMHLQTGKGGNIDALLPGITSVNDNPNPVTGGSLTYRSAATFNNSWNPNFHYRLALSYITGSHVFKVGYNNAHLHHENTTYSYPTTPYSFNFAGGVPTAISYNLVPRTIQADVDHDMGIFAQDRWTTGRWTLSGGIRFDYFANSFPEGTIEPTFLAPNLPRTTFAKIDNLSWKDVTPKLGATYDVFGDGRTAIKLTLNKYLEGMGTTGIGAAQVTDAPNPISRLSTTAQRPWTDVDGDFIPDCNLQNPGIDGECGALNNPNFGTIVPGTTYDPDVLTGWGKRTYNWEFTAAVQHEIAPRVSVDVQYARRWYGNFRITDDLAVSPADYDQFTLTVPTDARLPNSGGTLTGYDLTTAGFLAAPQYFVTLADNYGSMTERFDGVNVSVNARMQNGLLVQGGFGSGRVVTNDCEVVEQLPEMLHTFFGNPNRFFAFGARPAEFCEQNNGIRTRVQGLVSYVIPKIDVQLAGTFQNLPGDPISANYNAPAAATNLNRGFTFAPFRAINILPPGTLYEERLNQIDFRVSKIFEVNTTRAAVNFDFYNVTNSNSILSENGTYGAAWRSPTSILLPRLFKLSVQLDF